MDYSNMTLEEFTHRLSSGDPTPGGGGASALAGCLAAALTGMVAHLTCGRKKYADVREEMENVIREAESLQSSLLFLIGKDAEMFEPLSRAYSMPKGTKEEKDLREAVMEAALKDACQVPLEIMEKACSVLDLVQTVASHGSAAAVSDAGDAAAFCASCLQAAALNVFINTKYMKDRDLAREYNGIAQRMLDEAVPRADGIYRQVLESLRA